MFVPNAERAAAPAPDGGEEPGRVRHLIHPAASASRGATPGARPHRHCHARPVPAARPRPRRSEACRNLPRPAPRVPHRTSPARPQLARRRGRHLHRLGPDLAPPSSAPGAARPPHVTSLGPRRCSAPRPRRPVRGRVSQLFPARRARRRRSSVAQLSVPLSCCG